MPKRKLGAPNKNRLARITLRLLWLIFIVSKLRKGILMGIIINTVNALNKIILAKISGFDL